MKWEALILGFVLVVVVVSFGAWWMLVDRISPEEDTMGTIVGICTRINMYIDEHGVPPTSLNELPIRPGYDNSIQDGWRNEIKYEYDTKTETIRILSYGKDGVPSEGEGIDDIDLSVRLKDNSIDVAGVLREVSQQIKELAR